MDALGIVVIEGDCPGSSYYAAELHTEVEVANRIAAERGWTIRVWCRRECSTNIENCIFFQYNRYP
ncbi:MAG: hypothetical protein JSR64_23710 [Nitrospira sp.]|nr:hypothetical protein [Nitrospira sp.]